MDKTEHAPHFHFLTPEYIITLAEAELGMPLTNICRPYKSYINRVYELQTEGGAGIVIKRFDRRDLDLIEPLRAMRYIHFIAWCARQISDGGFSSLAPGWGTSAYWETEISDLARQIEFIEKEPSIHR